MFWQRLFLVYTWARRIEYSRRVLLFSPRLLQLPRRRSLRYAPRRFATTPIAARVFSTTMSSGDVEAAQAQDR